MRRGGPPPLGLHLLMGKTRPEKVANMNDNISKGRIAPVELIARKVPKVSRPRRPKAGCVKTSRSHTAKTRSRHCVLFKRPGEYAHETRSSDRKVAIVWTALTYQRLAEGRCLVQVMKTCLRDETC
jgi:hypothetical protein